MKTKIALGYSVASTKQIGFFMLPISTIYSFLHQSKQFSAHFFEGQKLIHDIVMNRDFSNESFLMLRNFVLATQPIFATTKPDEAQIFQLTSPNFDLKLETNFMGHLRIVLLSNGKLPNNYKINAKCKFTRVYNSKPDLDSFEANINNISTSNLIKSICKKVYQSIVHIYICPNSDQSLLILKSPIITNYPKFEINKDIKIDHFWTEQFNSFENILNQGLTDPSDIIYSFENLNFKNTSTHELIQQCSCSYEKMLQYIKQMEESSKESIFQGDEELELECHFCQKKYTVHKTNI